MNIRANNRTSVRRGNRSGNGPAPSVKGKMVTIFYVIMLVLCIGGVAQTLIYLNQQISLVERDIVDYKRKIHRLDREIDMLQARKAALSTRSHIQEQIKKFGLQLQEPAPRQVVFMSTEGRGVSDRANQMAVR